MNVHNREKELYLYGIEREREEEERERRKRGREMPLSPVAAQLLHTVEFDFSKTKEITDKQFLMHSFILKTKSLIELLFFRIIL